MMKSSQRRGRRAIVALAAIVSLTLTACGSEGDTGASNEPQGPPPSTDYFGYQTNTRLVTTNAGTAFGSATNSEVLSGRLYPAAFVPGPGGQLIPNSDLVTTRDITDPAPDSPRKILYTISEDARFSDGKPVACEDFLLAYKAGKMRDLFGSQAPLANEIASLQCAAGFKQFVVTFNPGQGERWRYLFGSGTVMPSHAIAHKAGMDQDQLVGALYAEDPTQLEEVARLWRYGFSVTDFDPELQLSYGPFVIDRIGPEGEVVLKANDDYYGDPPAIDSLVVWPRSADTQKLVDAGALKVADSASPNPDWFDRNAETNPYEVQSQVGDLTDTLVLSGFGLFSQQWARQAFAACVDQSRLAQVSSEESGIEVAPAYVHLLRHSDPLIPRLDPVTNPHKKPNMELAGGLAGQTIRVGYLGPDERLAAMVQALKQSCEPAGITIEDASAEHMSQIYLEMDPETGMPTIDAFLGPVDPMYEYGAPEALIQNVAALRSAEEKLWEDLYDIPVSAQPRTFILDKSVENVVPFTGLSGIGWNMDRWRVNEQLAAEMSAEISAANEENSEQ